MAYIRATGHSVPLMMQIAEGGHARVYASVLHARFGFHPTSIYIEEEVLSESGKVDRTILQLSLRDDEGQFWLLPPGRYRAFGLNAALMAASTDLVSQPSDMSSVQPPLLHSVKLEKPDNLVNLSSDSSEGALPNAPPPTPAADTPMSTQSLSSLLLVHLVIPTSLGHRATPILVNIPVSCSVLDAWPHFQDPGTN
jgi:hypothetical protein